MALLSDKIERVMMTRAQLSEWVERFGSYKNHSEDFERLDMMYQHGTSDDRVDATCLVCRWEPATLDVYLRDCKPEGN